MLILAIQVPIDSSFIMTKEGKPTLWQVDTNYNIIFVTNLWFECEECTYSCKYIYKQVWIEDL